MSHSKKYKGVGIKMSKDLSIIIRDLAKKLKTITTYEELTEFEKELNNYGEGLRLRSKKRKLTAFHFSHMYKGENLLVGELTREDMGKHFSDEKYKNRVAYLFDDGVSKGESYVRNLYRNLEVSD